MADLADFITQIEVVAEPRNDPILDPSIPKDHPWQTQPQFEATIKLCWSGSAPKPFLDLVIAHKERIERDRP